MLVSHENQNSLPYLDSQGLNFPEVCYIILSEQQVVSQTTQV